MGAVRALLAAVVGLAACGERPIGGLPAGGTGGTEAAGVNPPAATGTGGAVTGTGGAVSQAQAPACTNFVRNKAPCYGEPPCSLTCGPQKSGYRNCTCAEGMWNCPSCTYDPTKDYSCYHLSPSTGMCPHDPLDSSELGLPQSGSPCAIPPCQPCGSATVPAYRDSGGLPKIGYCVCSDPTTGIYSCAQLIDWPPQ